MFSADGAIHSKPGATPQDWDAVHQALKARFKSGIAVKKYRFG